MEIGSVVELTRRRKAEAAVLSAWYTVSVFAVAFFGVGPSVLNNLQGFDTWAPWVGRFALLPAVSAVVGIGFVLRHQWRGRGFVDRAFRPPLSREEPLKVAVVNLVAMAVVWFLMPEITLLSLGALLLLAGITPLWMGVRSTSSSRRVFQLLGVLLPGAGAGMFAIHGVYGPMSGATGPTLKLIFGLQVGVLGVTLVLGFVLLVLIGIAFLSAERKFDRGDLEGLVQMSFLGIAEDLPRVLDGLRRLGQHELLEKRYLASVSTVPLSGSLHVLAESLLARDDPRAAEVATQALWASPMHQGALLAYARAHRSSHPDRTLDAADAFGRTLVGRDRTPVFQALEALALTHLGSRARAIQVLADLEFGNHPVYADEARFHAREAEELLDSNP